MLPRMSCFRHLSYSGFVLTKIICVFLESTNIRIVKPPMTVSSRFYARLFHVWIFENQSTVVDKQVISTRIHWTWTLKWHLNQARKYLTNITYLLYPKHAYAVLFRVRKRSLFRVQMNNQYRKWPTVQCTTSQVPLLVVHSQMSGHFRSLGVKLMRVGGSK